MKSEDDNYDFSGKAKLMMSIMTILSVGCIMGAMLLDWTPLGSTEIQGVQGRYFIPVMPAIFLFFTNQTLQRNDKIKKRMKLLVDNSELVVIVMLCMSAIALLLRFWC